MRLANYVKVNTSYTRSINLERDAEIGSSIRPYVPTRRALQTLNRIAETMNLNDAPRAWSLIGPYGSGKSAFGLFLTQLLGNPEAAGTKNAKLVVKKSDAKLERNVSKLLAQTSGYCCINLTGSPEALSKRLVRAILSGAESFLKKGGSNIKVVKRLRDAVGAETVSSTEIVEILIELQKVVHQKNGAGVLIIIDELGKFLEFEARHRNASDIYLLQAIAELANKPNSVPLHFIVLLHQAFDQYFQGLGEQLKNEWKKVQGRFESVPFLESTEQTLLVLAETLVTNFSSSTIKLKNAQCDRILKVLGDVNALPAVFSTEAGSDLLKRCYPLHPLTLLLLPTLCQKVAQNERTLFTYLGGQEPHGFLDTISRLDISDKEVPWVMPWDIYEYFILNQPGLTTDHATHHRWAEVVTAIERLGDASIEEIRLIKTIGLLNIVGAYGGFKASKEIIALCGEDKSRAYSQALKSLQDKSIVTFRKFSGEFRIWQGSDFDLETAVSAQKEQMANLRFADMLNERVPLQPLVARRYGIETGSLRYFNPVFIDRDNVSNLVAANSPTIYFCLSETVQDEDVFVKEVALFANSLATVSIVDSAASFRESLLEIMALQRVQGSSPELASDPVAQRELKDRLARAVKNERNSILSILEEPTRSKWFWDSAQYKVSNKRALQELLTRVLKKTYSKTPYLHNELINREQPSSSAMSGRRKLLRAMLDMSELENLGIEKSPPEKSIYLSVLKSTGIHVDTGTGWKFARPQVEKAGKGTVQPLWQAIEDFFVRTEVAPLTVASLYEDLIKPPYGIKPGMLPVLFLAACLAYKDEIALYEEGYYTPFLTHEIIEKIVKSPSLFSVQRFRVDKLRDQLFMMYAKAITLDDPSAISMMAVVKPLAQFMVNLPDYTKRTKRVSEKAQKVREYFFSAKSPTQLLFIDLPEACGFAAIGPNTSEEKLAEFSKELKSIFAELRVAYHALLNEFQSMLRTTFNEGETVSLSQLRERLRGRYGPLQTYTIDTHGLKAFLGRISDPFGDDGHWLNSVATFIARKPPEKWLDEDLSAADYRLVELTKRLRDLERLRMHYEDQAAPSGTSVEFLMLRTVRQGGNDNDVIVALDESKKKAIGEKIESFRQILNDLPSEDLRLAILAQLFEEHVSAQREVDPNLHSIIEKGA